MRGVEGVGSCLVGTFDGGTWGLDILCHEERGEVLSALDCDPECLAPCPPSRCFGNRGGWPPIQRGGTSTGSSLSDLQGPVSSPGAPGRCCSPPVVLRVPGHGHRTAHSSENIDPVVGGASWSGACGVFSRGIPHVRPPSRRHVSFADGLTMLGNTELPVCSPKAELLPLILPVVVEEISDAPEPESPPLILPVVVEDNSVVPGEELIELVSSALDPSLPPPPGFSPFTWPVNDGGMDVDELCSRIGVDCSPSLSPISRVCADVSDSAVSPGVGVLVSPIIDGSSDIAPAVGHAGLPLPSVDNSFVQDMLGAPAAPQVTRPR